MHPRLQAHPSPDPAPGSMSSLSAQSPPRRPPKARLSSPCDGQSPVTPRTQPGAAPRDSQDEIGPRSRKPEQPWAPTGSWHCLRHRPCFSVLYTVGFCLRSHFWILLLDNIFKSMGHSCSFSIYLGKLRPRGQDLPKVTQQTRTQGKLEWSFCLSRPPPPRRGALPHQRGPVGAEQTQPLGASRLRSLGTLRVFGLASRPLCHETIFPAWVGSGGRRVWGDLNWGTKLCEQSRWGGRAFGGAFCPCLLPPPISLGLLPSNKPHSGSKWDAGGCIFGFQRVKANVFGRLVRHSFLNSYSVFPLTASGAGCGLPGPSLQAEGRCSSPVVPWPPPLLRPAPLASLLLSLKGEGGSREELSWAFVSRAG